MDPVADLVHASGLSIRKIVEKLSELGRPLSKSTVERIIKKHQLVLSGSPPETRKLPAQNKPTVCIPKIIRKVEKLIDSPNPPSIREIARRLRISHVSVKKILVKNLEAKLTKNKKVHALSATQAVQRAHRAKTFLRYLSRRKLKFLLTMDEMWITTDDLSGQTDFYYKRKNVVVPESWQKLPRKNWPKKVMLAMGISWRGQTAMYVVPPETKVDHKVFIDLVLKPMIRKDVPRLHGSDAKKVVLHMDSAPSHVAKETVQWLKAEKVKYIPKEEWLANSPDAAPMDYAVNSIFKRILKCCDARDHRQLARVARRKWKTFSIVKIRNALRSWKSRIRCVIKANGYQYEHIWKQNCN
ncbi:uncharacterized protein LOC129598204 [Paramacrobiotus metropolitanus]|uniref:uncharacterized protein LOC129598204 n=1 Tax=Paramacrobiotus metropolitanus TaxID=2943436 RepID=UPI002446393F|nr:uncharacterized protein LOC129598204 [Paramacrobiotus metropolitanus]